MDELKQEFGKFEVAFFAWKNEVNRHTEKLDMQYADFLSRIGKVLDAMASLAKRIEKSETIANQPDPKMEDIMKRLDKLEQKKPEPMKKSFWPPFKSV